MLISEPQFQGTTLIKPAFINNYTTNTDNKLDNNNNELISGFGMKVMNGVWKFRDSEPVLSLSQVVSVRPNNAQKGLPTVPGVLYNSPPTLLPFSSFILDLPVFSN